MNFLGREFLVFVKSLKEPMSSQNYFNESKKWTWTSETTVHEDVSPALQPPMTHTGLALEGSAKFLISQSWAWILRLEFVSL